MHFGLLEELDEFFLIEIANAPRKPDATILFLPVEVLHG